MSREFARHLALPDERAGQSCASTFLSQKPRAICELLPVIQAEANSRYSMVRGPLPGWSRRTGSRLITFRAMRSKERSVRRGFNSGALRGQKRGVDAISPLAVAPQ